MKVGYRIGRVVMFGVGNYSVRRNSQGSTMAQMAHFSFPYYFTIPNSECRIPKFALRISEFGIVKYI